MASVFLGSGEELVDSARPGQGAWTRALRLRLFSPRWLLLPVVLSLLGCEGQLQGASASPFARDSQTEQPVQAAAQPAMRTDALVAPQAVMSVPAMPAQPNFDPRTTAPPLLAPIPLRGKLEEDLVYDGLLDAQETLTLVRALEAANRESTEQAGSSRRQ